MPSSKKETKTLPAFPGITSPNTCGFIDTTVPLFFLPQKSTLVHTERGNDREGDAATPMG